MIKSTKNGSLNRKIFKHWAILHNSGDFLQNFIGQNEFFVEFSALVVMAFLVERTGFQINKPVDVVRFVFRANIVAVTAVVQLKITLKNLFCKNSQGKQR